MATQSAAESKSYAVVEQEIQETAPAVRRRAGAGPSRGGEADLKGEMAAAAGAAQTAQNAGRIGARQGDFQETRRMTGRTNYVAPDLFTAETPLGTYQGMTDQVVMSRTPGAFRTVLVPRGSSKPEWLPSGK